jgi:hypothetical protein
MPKRADFFRLKAAECRAIATRFKDQTSREQLEKTAQHWLQLAEDAELIDRIKDSRG